MITAARRNLFESGCDILLVACLVLIGAARASADDPAARATTWKRLEKHFQPPAEFAGKLGDYRSPLKFDDGAVVKTADDWTRRRKEILELWQRRLGPWPKLVEKPAVKRLETVQRDGHVEHHVHVQVSPDGKLADGYLLVPDGPGPFPAVLVPFYEPLTSIGRGEKGRGVGTHDYGLQLVRRGFVTLSIGTPGSVEKIGLDTRRLLVEAGVEERRQPLTLLAYVAANCHTALAQMPEVDPARIGIIGLSYGGKWTMFASCLYDKFACAVWSDPGIVFNEKNSNVNYWEPWYLGYDPKTERKPGVPSAENPRTGLYKELVDAGEDLVSLHALMAPRPVLVSGGTEDPPRNWTALNHLVAVNELLGHKNRVAMTARKTHVPTAEALEVELAFLEHWLKDRAKPNVVVILADDLGYGELGCYGHKRFKTPHLDRLAAEGARFTQCNTPMPFCAPTRAALLTGRYPFRCGMTNNPAPDGGPQADAVSLPAGEVTLAQLLKDAGYATGMVGKWHLGHQKVDYWPTRRGFDDYLGILASNDMRPVRLVDGEKVVEYPVVQTTLTKRYTERALKFIERNKDQPFFLYLAHSMPHKPLAVSEEFYKKSGAGLYGDVLAELDDSVGQVLAKLKQLGLDERTLVIFTSDNGPWFGGSTGGLRGMKGTTWEGGVRVPMIVRWPGRVESGKTHDALAITMDLYATALAAADVAPPSGRTIDGMNLLPMLVGKSKTGPHDVIFGHQGARLATVRDARWKLHVLPQRDTRLGRPGERWLDPRGPDGVTILAPYEQSQPTEYPGLRTGDETAAMSLFDLTNDPGEQHNVAAKRPEIVARLKARYDAVTKEFASP